jgi:hypothetical protein
MYEIPKIHEEQEEAPKKIITMSRPQSGRESRTVHIKSA